MTTMTTPDTTVQPTIGRHIANQQLLYTEGS